jgi:integrase
MRGKLLTERMVAIDEETLEIIDRIVANRSAGRSLRHPRTGKLADFLLTHQGRRVSADTLREELQRPAAEAGLDGVVPHQLRHIVPATGYEGRRAAALHPRHPRHVELATTDIYARASTEAKRKALEAAYTDIVTDDLPEWNQDPGLLNWLASL